MYRIDQLEDALVNALNGGGMAARAWHLPPDAASLAREAAARPVALVTYHRARAADAATFEMRNGADFFFHVHVAARNLRSRVSGAAERGDPAGGGIYTALDAIRALLAGNTLGLTIQPLLFVAEEPVQRAPELAVYRQEWQLTVIE